MAIKCDYDKPLYQLGDIVLYEEKAYVVIGSEYNFSGLSWYYELSPYNEQKLEFVYEQELEATE